MRAIIRNAGLRLYADADRLNVENMCRALRAARKGGALLDLGCGDGANTLRLAEAAGAARVDGVERYAPAGEAARGRGIAVSALDLDEPLPFADGSYRVVTSNQVIEHLSETDRFVAEIRRVLEPGGLAIVSTENLASWHNIFALIAGFAAFSTINYSDRVYPLGNPLSIHAGESIVLHDGMVHRRIFTTTGLRDLFAGHGFKVLGLSGSGYYPLPAAFGRFDPRHAHFITIAAEKPAA